MWRKIGIVIFIILISAICIGCPQDYSNDNAVYEEYRQYTNNQWKEYQQKKAEQDAYNAEHYQEWEQRQQEIQAEYEYQKELEQQREWESQALYEPHHWMDDYDPGQDGYNIGP